MFYFLNNCKTVCTFHEFAEVPLQVLCTKEKLTFETIPRTSWFVICGKITAYPCANYVIICYITHTTNSNKYRHCWKPKPHAFYITHTRPISAQHIYNFRDAQPTESSWTDTAAHLLGLMRIPREGTSSGHLFNTPRHPHGSCDLHWCTNKPTRSARGLSRLLCDDVFKTEATNEPT